MRQRSPARAELVVYAKAKGKDLKMGNSGIGAASHITCLLLFQPIDVEPTYVSYRGLGQDHDIMGGSLDGSCDLVASVSGHGQGGAVKALAVAAAERSPVLPEVPAASEAGLPDFLAETWTGPYAPKNRPPAVLARLREAVSRSLADPAHPGALRQDRRHSAKTRTSRWRLYAEAHRQRGRALGQNHQAGRSHRASAVMAPGLAGAENVAVSGGAAGRTAGGCHLRGRA